MPNMSHHYQRVVTFSLSPLTDFCETSDRILYELYESDMREVAKVLTDFTTSQQILNTLKDSKFSNDFLQGYGAMLTDLSKDVLLYFSVLILYLKCIKQTVKGMWGNSCQNFFQNQLSKMWEVF